MNITDKDLKKAFRKQEIPNPSDTAKNTAVQNAVKEFVQLNKENTKKTKGFPEFIRRMGKTFQNLINSKGEPIMTRKQFATIGVVVITFGLFLSIGPEFLFQKTQEPIKTITKKEDLSVAKNEQNKLKPTESDHKKMNDQLAPTPQPFESKTIADSTKEIIQPEPGKHLTVSKEGNKNKRGIATGEPLATAPLAEFQFDAEDAGVRAREAAARSTVVASAHSGAPQEVFEKSAFNSVGLGHGESPPTPYYKDKGRDQFSEITPNAIKLTRDEPVSTFSVDVDTASYAFMRRQLNNGLLPQKDAVRVEELINYFDYDYPLPQAETEPFKPTVALYPTPWNTNTKLLHIGIKGYDIVPEKKPRSNLVFLLDVSGSMNSPDKLPLLKNSFSMLVESLNPDDSVAIVVYAGASGTVLEPTQVKEKSKILASLDKLKAGGSTAGGEGIRLAYSLAEMNYDENAVNRVILATDGDFNVGITNTNELKSFIERKRSTGIFLSVIGFGQGNYNDALMQTLAQNGNGNAAYIDNLNEARKVLVDEAGSTLFTIAGDVKIQIEFNPAKIYDYRLIGYETRMLKREDFKNDKVDAGDVGSGHSITAIYEITPVESPEKRIDELRYQQKTEKPKADTSKEYAFLKIRYKLPGEEKSRLITTPITSQEAFNNLEEVPSDMRFASAVAAFGQLLRNDPHTGDLTYDDIIELAEPARGRDQFGYRTEFLNLVRLAKTAKAM